MKARQQHVLISGASSGIGEACALQLDQRGYRVFVGVRKAEDGERLQEASSGRLIPVMLDVTDGESVAAACDRVTEAVGDAGLVGLVNNAGIAVAGAMEAIPLDQVRRQFDVNFFGQLSVIQAFIPLLRMARGRLINMSSVSGRAVFPILGPYATSKHALEAASDALRLELRSCGVRVILVEPGAVETPIWEKSESATKRMVEDWPEAMRAYYQPMVDAVERASDKSRLKAVAPEKVAAVVSSALAARRPRARYTVGQDAWMMNRILRPLPDRIRDWVIVRVLGLS